MEGAGSEGLLMWGIAWEGEGEGEEGLYRVSGGVFGVGRDGRGGEVRCFGPWTWT